MKLDTLMKGLGPSDAVRLQETVIILFSAFTIPTATLTLTISVFHSIEGYVATDTPPLSQWLVCIFHTDIPPLTIDLYCIMIRCFSYLKGMFINSVVFPFPHRKLFSLLLI